ncbi:hypothetical protein QTH90_18370 [Variovorax sp. J2P1-59]|nr:hypothetical protein [Variovorax sp. J2P1-59]MDM0076381.1 hypothetical protein [Variovorax sp. J2P1-59]
MNASTSCSSVRPSTAILRIEADHLRSTQTRLIPLRLRRFDTTPGE